MESSDYQYDVQCRTVQATIFGVWKTVKLLQFTLNLKGMHMVNRHFSVAPSPWISCAVAKITNAHHDQHDYVNTKLYRSSLQKCVMG